MSTAEGELQGDPTARVEVVVTSNAVLRCSQFCLTECGLYGEAQQMALTGSMMVAQKDLSVDFAAEDPKIQVEGGVELPEFVMTCKGPRKRFWVAGELVCRKQAKIDTA